MAGFSAQVWVPEANDTVFCRLGNFLKQATLHPALQLPVFCHFQAIFDV
jgi:hypothetical protein